MGGSPGKEIDTMAVSKAQQRAQNKWIAKAYDRVNLTLPKGQKEVVQAHASTHGESVNGFIGRAISETMERDSGRIAPGIVGKRPESAQETGVVFLPSEAVRTAQEGAETGTQPAPVDKVKAGEKLFSILGCLGTVELDKAKCERLGIMYLPPDILEAAQQAAERTGETVVDFVARAVAEQQRRDDRSFKMGINPA